MIIRTAIVILLLSGAAMAQSTTTTTTAVDEEEGWSLSATLYPFVVPQSRDYVSPIVTADHGGLHLEARYNYEDMDTASAFIGWNFSWGEELSLELTPKIGVVGGRSEG